MSFGVPSLSAAWTSGRNAAYDDGRVYVVNGGGLLTAFDAATATTVWSKQLPGQSDFSAPPTAAALIAACLSQAPPAFAATAPPNSKPPRTSAVPSSHRRGPPATRRPHSLACV